LLIADEVAKEIQEAVANAERTDGEGLQALDVLTDEAKDILRERVRLWIKCELEEKTRLAVIRMCKYGTPEMPGYLFFFRMFATIFEPRNSAGLKKLPFVPYEYQIEELEVIHRAVTRGEGVNGQKSTTLWLKSRDMGLTWLVLMYFVWDFLFNEGSYHVGSFKEVEVDKLGTMNTLFGKMRFALAQLPDWIKPKDLQSSSLILSYKGGEVSITGESSNAGFGRSKRVKACLMDEYQKWENDRLAYAAVTGGTTNVVFLVGTPYGYGNHFAEICQRKVLKNTNIRKIHWSAHPLKNKDLTWLEGKATSDWYRRACAELEGEEQIIAAELDLSFDASVKGPIYASSYGPGHQKKGLIPIPGIPFVRMWDLGGWSAVLIGQYDRHRRFIVYREVVTEGEKLQDVKDKVLAASEELARSGLPKEEHARWEKHFLFEDCGDPSGSYTSKSNQIVPEYEELESDDIYVDWMYMSDMPTELRIRARHIAVQKAMARYIPGNQNTEGPGFWIDVDQCPILDEALRGGYRYRTTPDGKVIPGKPEERHPYNDVADALGYGVIYKAGVPEQIKKEASKQTSEEELEDEAERDFGAGTSRRTRC
jgi:hypothetical protein